jgi:hypothetical protein
MAVKTAARSWACIMAHRFNDSSLKIQNATTYPYCPKHPFCFKRAGDRLEKTKANEQPRLRKYPLTSFSSASSSLGIGNCRQKDRPEKKLRKMGSFGFYPQRGRRSPWLW